MDLVAGHCLLDLKDKILKGGSNPRYEHFQELKVANETSDLATKKRTALQGPGVSTLFPPKTNKVKSFSPYCCSCVTCVYHVFIFVYIAFYIKTAWGKTQVCLYCSLNSWIMKLMPTSRHLPLYILVVCQNNLFLSFLSCLIKTYM